MLRSIRWRIALPYIILILITMLGLGIYLTNFVRQVYLNDIESQLAVETRLVSNELIAFMRDGVDYDTLNSLVQQMGDLTGARVTIIGLDGVVIGESMEDRLTMDNHLNRPEVIQALAQGQGTSIRHSDSTGMDMLYYATRMEIDGEPIVIVRLALPLIAVDNKIAGLQLTLIGVTLAVTLFALLLTILIASQTTRSIRKLTQAADRMASGDLDTPIVISTDDDVGRLSIALNRMATQLRNEVDALRTERSKLSAILSQMTDGLVMVGQDGKIGLINPAAEEMFSTTHELAIGNYLAGSLQQHQVVELWYRTRESGNLESTTFEVSSKRIYLQGIAVQLEQELSGNTLLLFQNLTRQRYLETVRQDFISNISHELRTPLAALKALTETLEETALEDPPAARRFLQRMETEVDSLSLMVSELLELSRIESGRVPLNFKPTKPCDIVNPAVERLSLQAERAGLILIKHCTDNLPLIKADPVRLEQVMVNLLHNAIKFTPSGGQIDIIVFLREDGVIFSVRDTGIGISQHDLPRIFERFYKVDRARSGGGTGLGLAISRHLVEAHDGLIWADSEEGVGSTFSFSIPLA